MRIDDAISSGLCIRFSESLRERRSDDIEQQPKDVYVALRKKVASQSSQSSAFVHGPTSTDELVNKAPGRQLWIYHSITHSTADLE
jgi:hypothetical protein